MALAAAWDGERIIFVTPKTGSKKLARYLVYSCGAWVTNHVQTWRPYRLKETSIPLDLLEKKGWLTKGEAAQYGSQYDEPDLNKSQKSRQKTPTASKVIP